MLSNGGLANEHVLPALLFCACLYVQKRGSPVWKAVTSMPRMRIDAPVNMLSDRVEGRLRANTFQAVPRFHPRLDAEFELLDDALLRIHLSDPALRASSPRRPWHSPSPVEMRENI
ncbi:MAG: hypothetical protein JWO80_3268 [Bryobacterales bacterium]|nr:hypothetical protein [Bryobacterales bacterium]